MEYAPPHRDRGRPRRGGDRRGRGRGVRGRPARHRASNLCSCGPSTWWARWPSSCPISSRRATSRCVCRDETWSSSTSPTNRTGTPGSPTARTNAGRRGSPCACPRLKERVERAADHEGLSTNAWLVAAVKRGSTAGPHGGWSAVASPASGRADGTHHRRSIEGGTATSRIDIDGELDLAVQFQGGGSAVGRLPRPSPSRANAAPTTSRSRRAHPQAGEHDWSSRIARNRRSGGSVAASSASTSRFRPAPPSRP